MFPYNTWLGLDLLYLSLFDSFVRCFPDFATNSTFFMWKIWIVTEQSRLDQPQSFRIEVKILQFYVLYLIVKAAEALSSFCARVTIISITCKLCNVTI